MKMTLVKMMIAAGIFVTVNLSAQSVTGTNEGVDKSTPVEKQQINNGAGPKFVDLNGDGICDNRNGRGFRHRNYVDTNNDGVCDNFEGRGGRGNGRNFTDANNDGICDHFAEGKPGCCQGNREGCRNGRGFKNRNGQK